MSDDNTIQTRVERIKERIREAALACGRSPDAVRLVAVSKTKTAALMEEGILAGITDLGENYIQEARQKIQVLSSHPVTWHFIGHLQSNKAKYAVELFDLIHTLDSAKLARELNKCAAARGLIQKVLIQVNIGQEATKSGVRPEETIKLAAAVAALENLSLRGLMTLPPVFNAPAEARPFFAAVRRLAEEIDRRELPGVSMAELSMGMTGDFEAAIAEGATLVRIGTAIFGERQ